MGKFEQLLEEVRPEKIKKFWINYTAKQGGAALPSESVKTTDWDVARTHALKRINDSWTRGGQEVYTFTIVALPERLNQDRSFWDDGRRMG